ncbi:MAG: phosphatase PAP2 family protein [bacterium]|nr:phosphatase PAP2 family protein [bacterium]
MNIISTFDLQFEQALYTVRSPSLAQFYIWFTELGDYKTVIPALTIIALIILAYKKRWALAAGLSACISGSYIAVYALKELIARPRPPGYLNMLSDNGYSFPSGHATFSFALYTFLLWIIWDSIPPAWKKPTIGVVAVLIIAIGYSRLYLGVHYPSDVLAGYVLGGIFVLLGIKVARILGQKTTSDQRE